jgi:hypothetical protein
MCFPGAEKDSFCENEIVHNGMETNRQSVSAVHIVKQSYCSNRRLGCLASFNVYAGSYMRENFGENMIVRNSMETSKQTICF